MCVYVYVHVCMSACVYVYVYTMHIYMSVYIFPKLLDSMFSYSEPRKNLDS